MYTVSLFLTLMFLSPQPDNYPDRPNISGWTIVSQINLEVKVDDYNTCSLGLVTEYRNPQDPNERVKVISRQTVILSERPRESSSDSDQGRSTLTIDVGAERHQKNENDALNRVHKAIDPIAFIRWHIKNDEAHNEDVQDGMMEFWFMGQDGNWPYKVQAEPNAILQAPVSEPSAADNSRSVLVGLKLSFGDASQVLRLDSDDLKPKEANHVK